MLKEKYLLLAKSHHQFKDFIHKVNNKFEVEHYADFDSFIVSMKSNKFKDSYLYIFFVEHLYLKDVSFFLSHTLNPLNYILISFSDKIENSFSNYNDLFDFIYLNSNAEFNFDFFCNKLNQEINNKNRISLLQDEVKEFYEIGKSLTSEKNTIKLFETIINSSINLTSSDAATMYLVVDQKTGKWTSIKDNNFDNMLLKFVIAKNTSIDIHFEETTSPITKESISGYTIISGRSIRIDDVYRMNKYVDFEHNKSFDIKTGYRTKSMLSIPMKDYENNIMGVIQLINKKRNREETIIYSDDLSINKIIPYDYTDEMIMNSIAGQAAVALENNLLYENMKELLHDYKQQNEHLSFLSRKILKAHEEERKRIAREIHDGPAQSTANLSLKLDICKKLFQTNDVKKAFHEIDDLKKEFQSTIKEIRTILYDLKPTYLEGGIISALKNRLNIFRDTTNINVEFNVFGDDSKIEYFLTTTIYRIVQEALSNISKHSKADKVTITVKIMKDTVFLNITDNGQGFKVTNLSSKKKSLQGGFGLEGIRERIEIVRGTLDIHSKLGKGTSIEISIPLN